MNDGSDKRKVHESHVSVEKLLNQRNGARLERDDLRLIIRELLRLRGVPDSPHYREARAAVWEAAREVLRKRN